MFENYRSKVVDIEEARLVLADIRALYHDAKKMQAKLGLYQSGANPTFNAAVDVVFTLEERQELGRMLTEVNALIANWEADHKDALGIQPPPEPLLP